MHKRSCACIITKKRDRTWVSDDGCVYVSYNWQVFSFQNPAFLEKFIINDVVPSDINDETVLEFQVYSSHHVTRRHLVGVTSISLRAIETLENGLVDLTIMPQTVYRVSNDRRK